jgi:hypothetical protein
MPRSARKAGSSSEAPPPGVMGRATRRGWSTCEPLSRVTHYYFRTIRPRRSLILTLLAAVVFAVALTGGASASAATCSGTFRVLNSDRIGSLKLPAGPYTITTSGGVGCQQAATLFNRFLEDWDGNLPNKWKVSGSGFRQGASEAAFTVTPAKSTPVPPPSGGGGPICPGAFTLTAADRILNLTIPAGNYAIQLLSSSKSLGCGVAAREFAAFLRGNARTPLPSPWTLNSATSTFSRGGGLGFRIIVAGGSTGGGGRTTGFTCPGTFQVVHSDRINSLKVPAGSYYLYALGDIGCVEVVNRFRSFLSANRIPPHNWTLNTQTATFLYQGNRGFRVEPVNGV